MKSKFAAQLYTLRNELEKDFPGTLRELKKMGWEAVQIDGLFGYDPEEIAEVLKETDLKTAGMHVSLDRINDDLDNVLKEADLFGTKYFYCHFLEDHLQNVEGYKKVKHDLLRASNHVKDRGYRVGYHHHAFEFETIVDNQVALDYLFNPISENEYIVPEIDTYWVKKAGVDPLAYIEKFPKKIPILHLKDMSDDEEETFKEVGEGSIDFLPILKWGERNEVEYYAVEQDYCPGSPLDSLYISLTNLIKMSKEV